MLTQGVLKRMGFALIDEPEPVSVSAGAARSRAEEDERDRDRGLDDTHDDILLPHGGVGAARDLNKDRRDLFEIRKADIQARAREQAQQAAAMVRPSSRERPAQPAQPTQPTQA